MLTGDKLETAENIGISCQLIQRNFIVQRCSTKQPKEIKNFLKKSEKAIKQKKTNQFLKMGIIVEGNALTALLDEKYRLRFLKIALVSDSVIVCRVTPKQKADVVRLIKNNTDKITLAIGDGANDVNMIQEAHIGIGLFGNEGLRAVQASDYALAEFRFLRKLILVHGRWSYIRISELILYFFYKNVIYTFPQFLFSFFSLHSGMTCFDDWYMFMYNSVFTMMPLFVKAIIQQDVNYKVYDSKNEIISEYHEIKVV